MLPYWQVKRVTLGDKPLLEVRCTRKECGQPFWVPLSWRTRIRAGTTIGRSCPWCSRTFQLPPGKVPRS